MSYRAKSEGGLAELSDEDLIAQLVAAREHGDLEQARQALAIFAFRRLDELTWRAKMRLKHQEDAEDIAQQAMLGALRASFDGNSVGEAVNLMHTIVDRRIADLYRSREGKQTQSLPEEASEEDKRGAPDAAIEQDETGRVQVQDVIDREYAKLDNEPHRMVVDLKVFQKFSSKETAKMVNQAFPDLEPPMSDQNADQIASRFRRSLRGGLEGGA